MTEFDNDLSCSEDQIECGFRLRVIRSAPFQVLPVA